MATDLSDSSQIFDPESSTELARLIDWDHMKTRTMGGPLAELLDSTVVGLRSVLDLGCGPGGWVLDTAFAYPYIDVIGVDISTIAVDYANTCACSQSLTNASFSVMDITKPLDFADASFDLVNACSVLSVLRKDAWLPFIVECTRLLRPRGILRLTDLVANFSTSSAYVQWNALMLQALDRVGYGFSSDGRSINVTTIFPWMLRKAGYHHVHHATFTLECSADIEMWANNYRIIEMAIRKSQPLLANLGLITSEALQQLGQKWLIEAHDEDFCCMQHYVTVWGTNLSCK